MTSVTWQLIRRCLVPEGGTSSITLDVLLESWSVFFLLFPCRRVYKKYCPLSLEADHFCGAAIASAERRLSFPFLFSPAMG